MSRWPWSELGIEPTREAGDVRKAYSAKLKQLDLDRQIAEFARLREARDQALFLVRQPEVEPDAEPESDDDEEDWSEDFNFDEDFDWDSMFPDEHVVPHHYTRHAQFDPAPGAEPERPDPEMVEAWRTLETQLFPGGSPSDAGLDPEEYAAADSAVETLVAKAHAGDIRRFEAIDLHLAEIMAQGWPRSAPLVERCNAEFHWLGEAGQLVERPCLRFLNARIAGMQFHEQVQRPDHRLHRAWIDLTGNTTPVWIRRWRVTRDTVMELLQTIRRQYPELEDLLDGDRIKAWEESTAISVPGIIRTLAILYFIGMALRFCVSLGNEPAQTIPPADKIEIERMLDEAAAESFGPAWDGDRVARVDSAFFMEFAIAAHGMGEDAAKRDASTAPENARNFIRRRILAARPLASFGDRVRIHALYLSWLSAASIQGDEACRAALSQSDLASDKGGAPSEEEQAMAAKLLEGGKFASKIGSVAISENAARSGTIPARLVTETIELSGLGEEQVREGLSQEASPHRCAAIVALMQAIARSPDKAPPELLLFP